MKSKRILGNYHELLVAEIRPDAFVKCSALCEPKGDCCSLLFSKAQTNF